MKHRIRPAVKWAAPRCLPRPVYHVLSMLYQGYDLLQDDFAWKAQRAEILLSSRRPLRTQTVEAMQDLLDSAQTAEQYYAASSLLDAVRLGQVDELAKIARHCSLVGDARAIRIVSKKYRFIWFSAPRVASCSTSSALLKLDPKAKLVKEVPTDDFCRQYSPELQDYYTFGFMRHPLDRLWAGWQDRVLRGRPAYGLYKEMDFPSFCEWVASPWGADCFSDKHRLSQTYFLTLPDGSPLDFTGKLETVDDDWRTVLERIGLPHVELPHHHQSRPPKRGEGPDSLDADLLDRLRERYAGDFALGGYPRP